MEPIGPLLFKWFNFNPSMDKCSVIFHIIFGCFYCLAYWVTCSFIRPHAVVIYAATKNVPGIPGACATRNFTYLVRGPWLGASLTRSYYRRNVESLSFRSLWTNFLSWPTRVQTHWVHSGKYVIPTVHAYVLDACSAIIHIYICDKWDMSFKQCVAYV